MTNSLGKVGKDFYCLAKSLKGKLSTNKSFNAKRLVFFRNSDGPKLCQFYFSVFKYL